MTRPFTSRVHRHWASRLHFCKDTCTCLSFLLKRGLFLTVLLLALGDTSILVLLIFRDQIIHIGLCLGELHLIHSLASVPMQESLSSEHGGELVPDTLEELLDGGRVANEG